MSSPMTHIHPVAASSAVPNHPPTAAAAAAIPSETAQVLEPQPSLPSTVQQRKRLRIPEEVEEDEVEFEPEGDGDSDSLDEEDAAEESNVQKPSASAARSARKPSVEDEAEEAGSDEDEADDVDDEAGAAAIDEPIELPEKEILQRTTDVLHALTFPSFADTPAGEQNKLSEWNQIVGFARAVISKMREWTQDSRNSQRKRTRKHADTRWSCWRERCYIPGCILITCCVRACVCALVCMSVVSRAARLNSEAR
jgi:hypothetical protein